jgi:hypothetical protein
MSSPEKQMQPLVPAEDAAKLGYELDDRDRTDEQANGEIIDIRDYVVETKPNVLPAPDEGTDASLSQESVQEKVYRTVSPEEVEKAKKAEQQAELERIMRKADELDLVDEVNYGETPLPGGSDDDFASQQENTAPLLSDEDQAVINDIKRRTRAEAAVMIDQKKAGAWGRIKRGFARLFGRKQKTHDELVQEKFEGLTVLDTLQSDPASVRETDLAKLDGKVNAQRIDRFREVIRQARTRKHANRTAKQTAVHEQAFSDFDRSNAKAVLELIKNDPLSVTDADFERLRGHISPDLLVSLRERVLRKQNKAGK